MADEHPTTWVVTDGAAGNENQCLALAAALGVTSQRYQLQLRQPWDFLAPHFRNGARRAIQGPLRDALNGPLPGLLITCGRRATLASTAIKRLSGGRTYTVHLLNPRIDPGLFDLVICPRHDALTGANVVNTLGALNDVSEQSLLAARATWATQFDDQPAPRIVVLIGASNRAYDITPEFVAQIADTVDTWIEQHGGSTLVSTSRRTSDEINTLVRQRFGATGPLWTGGDQADNPYTGYLAYGDVFVVTPDSVNMCSEAAATGKPLYVSWHQRDQSKFGAFHQALREAGIERDLREPLDLATVKPLRETDAVAAQVLARFSAARGAAGSVVS